VRPGLELSVIAPLYNEVEVVEALARRCLGALDLAGRAGELILVDDASQDGTWAALEALAAEDPRLRPHRLSANRGQLGATCAGLALARGGLVGVIDGDLQDPPERIPALVEALEAAGPEIEVAFAVKRRRDDPLWFRGGRLGYQLLQRLLAPELPAGAGAYCVMRAPLAARVAALAPAKANLAAVLAALGARGVAVPYDKEARYDGHSRVGPAGLVREALGSLALISAPGRWWLRRGGRS